MQRHPAGATTAPTSVVDLLALRASEHCDDLIYRYLADDESEACITYGELDRAAQRIAAVLAEAGVEDEPVLLLYPPGLDYIAAFFGCLYAGAIAVPAYPPRPGRMMRRLETIVGDSGARVALTTVSIRTSLRASIIESQRLGEVQWLSTDDLPVGGPAEYRPRTIAGEKIAFLQYTSGSTGEPKGVMVSHGNLLHNLTSIYNAFDTRDCVGMSWLPMYHDMGLIGGILGVVQSGGHAMLFSPFRFLQRPLCWLEYITRYKVTHAGAPNFAYDLCVDRISPEECGHLDLSSWQCAFNGAETIRGETLDRFAAAFGPYGFRADAFYPCYGLAESTLMVTSRVPGDAVERLSVPKRQLELGRAVAASAPESDVITLVSSGTVVGNQRVLVVDPQTRRPCPAGRVGEIWIQGPSVTRGYWNRPEASQETFAAELAEGDAGPFLRSGDLGVFHANQLFITGRSKDLIIIRGRNHYPQDIEFTAQSSCPELQPNSGAAFALQRDGREQVVLLQEVRREALRTIDGAAAIAAIRQAVLEEYEIRLDAVGLVRPGRISRTTSGKIERFACRQRYLDGDFEFVELWTAPTDLASPRGPAPPAAPVDEPAAATLDGWISQWLARRLQLDPAAIDPAQPLAHYGLDSLMAVELLHDFERQFGRELEIGTLIDARSIAELTQRLSTKAGDPAWPLWAHDTSDALLPGIARPTWRGPFGDRPDGILVRGESPVREMMPYLMRGRNESVAYHDASYDISRSSQWLEQYNRQHPEARATLFDLFIWAVAYVAHARPGINRFVSGGRIYQRREVSLSFAAKKRFDAAAPLVTIKLRFPERQEPFAACVQRIAAGIDEACNGPPRTVDRETQFAMRLPRFLLRAALWGYRVLDYCNLLPGKVIENDPLYASMFVANLASLGLDNTFHHLYEHGTCSVFAALGLPRRTVVPGAGSTFESRLVWSVRWTLDERIADGFYSAGCMRLLKSILENPGEFVPTDRA